MMPAHVIHKLRDGETVAAEHFSSATFIFIQICHFEEICSRFTALQLVEICSRFTALQLVEILQSE